MGKVYDNIITTTAGFKYNAEQPLDDREVVENYNDLNTLVDEHSAFEGMKVYVKEKQQTYELRGDKLWYPIGNGSGNGNGVLEIAFPVVQENGWYRIASTDEGVENYNALLQLSAKRLEADNSIENEEMVDSSMLAVSGNRHGFPEIMNLIYTSASWGGLIKNIRIVYTKFNESSFVPKMQAHLEIEVKNLNPNKNRKLDLTLYVINSEAWKFNTVLEPITTIDTNKYDMVVADTTKDIAKFFDTTIIKEHSGAARIKFPENPEGEHIVNYKTLEEYIKNNTPPLKKNAYHEVTVSGWRPIAQIDLNAGYGLYHINMAGLSWGGNYCVSDLTCLVNIIGVTSASGSIPSILIFNNHYRYKQTIDGIRIRYNPQDLTVKAVLEIKINQDFIDKLKELTDENGNTHKRSTLKTDGILMDSNSILFNPMESAPVFEIEKIIEKPLWENLTRAIIPDDNGTAKIITPEEPEDDNIANIDYVNKIRDNILQQSQKDKEEINNSIEELENDIKNSKQHIDTQIDTVSKVIGYTTGTPEYSNAQNISTTIKYKPTKNNVWYRIAYTNIGQEMRTYNSMLQFSSLRDGGKMYGTSLAIIGGSYDTEPDILLLNYARSQAGSPLYKIRVVYPTKSRETMNDPDVYSDLQAFLDVQFHLIVSSDGQVNDVDFILKSLASTGWNFNDTLQEITDKNIYPENTDPNRWNTKEQDITKDLSFILDKLQEKDTSLQLSVDANRKTIQANTNSIAAIATQLQSVDVLKIQTENSYSTRKTADGEPVISNSVTNIEKIYGNTAIIDSTLRSAQLSGIQSTGYNLIPPLDSILDNNMLQKIGNNYRITRTLNLHTGLYFTKPLSIELPKGNYYLRYKTITKSSYNANFRFYFYTISGTQLAMIQGVPDAGSNQNKSFNLSQPCSYIKLQIPSDGGEECYIDFTNLEIVAEDKQIYPYQSYLKNGIDFGQTVTLSSIVPDYPKHKLFEQCTEYIDFNTQKMYYFWNSVTETRVIPKLVNITWESIPNDFEGVGDLPGRVASIPNAVFTKNGKYYSNPVQFINIPDDIIWSFNNKCGFIFLTKNGETPEFDAVEGIKAIVLDFSELITESSYTDWNTNMRIFNEETITSDGNYIVMRNGTEQVLGNSNAEYGVYPIIVQDYLILSTGE